MSDLEMNTPAGSNENQKTDSGLTNGLSGLTADPLRFIPPVATSSPQSKVAPTSVPVPVPYRERSASFDRSRASKVEREAKRRSYYPNHVTAAAAAAVAAAMQEI